MPPKFVPRQRKHKVLARENAARRHEVVDSNQEVLPTAHEDADERKRRLRGELLQSAKTKVSGKKAKRLDKYIENKLRKDENRDLLAKLAQVKVDTSQYTSSRLLGSGRVKDRETRARDGSDEPDDLEREVHEEAEHVDEDVVAAPKEFLAQPETEAGVGLKRPLEVDEDGRPIIPKRQRRRGAFKSKPQPAIVQEPDFEEWGGFESTNSEVDTSGSSEGGDDPKNADASESEDESSEDDAEENIDNTQEEMEDSDSDNDDDDEETDDDEDDEEDSGSDHQRPSRSSAFKSWALQQRNEALGYQPTDGASSALTIPKPDNFVPRAPEQDPLPRELQPTTNMSRKSFSVAVSRTPEVQEARLKLPVVAEEQRIMESIHNNDIVVICGDTGSGKTTQIPQFLFEAGYGSPGSPNPGRIGVTQPRRVAAVSMSRRVADELGDHSKKVAYQIRFEGTVDSKTAIKFMTDGVLMREIAKDFALRTYSAIVIDEAHERSVNTDILIGMLSRVVKLRAELAQEDTSVKPLKLIIMSATLRIEDFTKNPALFATEPPTVKVEGRQHRVDLHFARRTAGDYVEEAFRKVSRGHKKLPPGGFLVFLTGRDEITRLSRRLKAAFGGLQTTDGPKVQIPAKDAPMEVEDIELGDVDDDAAAFDDLSSDNDEDDDEFQIEDDQESAPLKVQVLPLYSLLPTREQLRVFETPPEGTRQIILATNVAETSLTIPGTRYVFDCGRSKERKYDRLTGVQSYEIGYISKASAEQRAGRAGRTGPGHCYRLYSSAVYESDFAQFADPEILRMPVEGVVLQLKAMRLQKVVNFPFPTPPDRTSLAKAEKLLTTLSALSQTGEVTQVGSTMSLFPLSPRLARILLIGHLHNCIHYTIALVAGLSGAEVFIPESQAIPDLTSKEHISVRTNSDVIAENRQANVRKFFNEVHRNFCSLDDKSDAAKLLQVVGEFAHEPTEEWSDSHFVRFKSLKEIQQLRTQLTDLLRQNIPEFAKLRFQDKLDRPSPKQVSAIKQIAAAGFIDQVAIRADLAPTPPEQYRKPKRPIDVPYLPLFPLQNSHVGDINDQAVYIHPTSPLAHTSIQECPQFIVYSRLQKTTPSGLNSEKKPKTRMHALTDISGGQLAALAKGTPLITYGRPIKEVKGTVGADGLLTREVFVVPYLRAENTGGQGWPLPARKVKQKKVAGKGWVVE